MSTPTEVLTRHGIELSLDDETIAELDVPVLTGPQRQGDVGIFPRAVPTTHTMPKVPAEGVAVVVGEATGNRHELSPEPGATSYWKPTPAGWGDDTILGTLLVESVCWLIHTEEHAVLGIGPGCYEVRGKRTQREVIERVQD